MRILNQLVDLKNNPIRIGVFGVGAIGCVLTCSLLEQFKVYYFNRSAKTSVSLLYKGVTLNKEIQLTNNKDFESLDWLIICIKGYHYENAKNIISQIVSSKTKITVIRNGLHLKEGLPSKIPPNQILECIIDCPTETIAPNKYHQLRKGVIITEKNKSSREFISLFKSNRIELLEEEDFHTFKWQKLIESACFGGLLTAFNINCSFFQNPDAVLAYKHLLRESIQVAQADGAEISEDFINELLKKLKTYPISKGSSMLHDRRQNRRLEWKSKNGAIVDAAKRHKVDCRLNEHLCLSLAKIDEAIRYSKLKK